MHVHILGCRARSMLLASVMYLDALTLAPWGPLGGKQHEIRSSAQRACVTS